MAKRNNEAPDDTAGTPPATPLPIPLVTPPDNTEHEEEFGSTDAIASMVDEIKEENPQFSNKSGVASTQELELITENILTQIRTPNNSRNKNKVLASIAVLVQEGATSPRFSETYTCQLFHIPVSVKNVRKACVDNKTTVRKLARAIRDHAVIISSKLNIEGNLSKTYKLQYQDYQADELHWVSDFQTFSDNPAMPPRVKKWLLENYNNRFNKNS